MRRKDLIELHNIVVIENIRSIMSRSILSRTRARGIPHETVAMEAIQAKRDRKRVTKEMELHDYANLYFHARNPMMSVLRNRHAELCVLRISPTVLDIPGVVVADQNASSKYARFDDAEVGVERISHYRVFAESWTHPEDQVEEWRHKSEKCAEVLVPHVIAPSQVLGAYVSCEQSQARLHELGFSLPVSVDPHLFFFAG